MNERTLQNAFFLGLLILTTAAFFGLIEAFLMPIFWAAVLATIFHPLYRWCRQGLGGAENVAAAGTTTAIVLIVLIPLLLTGMAVASEAGALYNRLSTGELNPQAVVNWAETHLPAVVEVLSRFGLTTGDLQRQLSSAAVGASRFLATEAVAVGQNTLRIAGLLFLMLYLLFFFLRDGTRLVDIIIGAVPIGDVRERRLLNNFAEVTRATLKGTLAIGIVQGGIGGVLFWLFGIDGAVLWGVVMGLLSLLPAVGAALVWVPAAALLLFVGETAKGLLLLVSGAVLIGLADNILRPLLVGRDTQMPDYLILVSTLGGIALFGISGVIIGPVLASLFLAVWTMFAEEYAEAAGGASTRSGQAPGTSPEEASPSP
jgi:predicted PurR-regulated permease PerM